jgi:hypothetical protein
LWYLFANILADTSEVGQDSGLDKYKSFVWVALILIVGFYLLIRTQRRVSQSMKKKELTAQERVNRHTGGKDIYSQINLLMSDLADLSRQINGQIDTRIAKLQIIMRQAEQTIARLEKLTGNEYMTGNAGLNGDNSTDHGLNSENISKKGENSNFDKTISDISDEFHHKNSTGVTDSAARQDGAQVSNQQRNNSSGVHKIQHHYSNNSLYTKQTLDLSARGYSALQIAKELNRPVGEIELILALQLKKGPSE